MRKFLIFIVIILSFSSAYSQNKGSLFGIVKDSLNEPLEGVTVKIKGSYAGSVTDVDGKYNIQNISPGAYTVEVNAIGYRTVEYTNIKIEEAKSKELNIVLSQTSFTVDQEIVVIGDRPLLDIEQTSSKHIISSEDIQKTNVQNIQDIVIQQAVVLNSDNEIYIRGGRSYENY